MSSVRVWLGLASVLLLCILLCESTDLETNVSQLTSAFETMSKQLLNVTAQLQNVTAQLQNVTHQLTTLQRVSDEVAKDMKARLAASERKVAMMEQTFNNTMREAKGALKGQKGETGLRGSAGPTGNKGDMGALGVNGQPGPTGSPGRDGTSGRDGLPGPAGAPGSSAPAGQTTGLPGPAGPPGKDGNTGPTGAPGTPGQQGLSGPIGPPGNNGVNGAAGFSGPPGLPGQTGPSGPPGPGNQNGGVVYVRWGRTVCPNDAKLIYKGMVASSHYNTPNPPPGGMINYLCLPDEPQWSSYSSGFQDAFGKVYGSQYNLYTSSGGVNPRDLSVTLGLAACAVCKTPPTRTSKVMIPANNRCPFGWTMEYNGYMLAEGTWSNRRSGRHAECFDGNPEYVQMYNSDWIGATLGYQEVNCNPLPCDKYPNGLELACVVCTQ